MRSTLILAGLITAVLALAAGAAAQNAPPASERQADEQAIRQAAEAFARAYNAHDAAAVAALFTPDAEIVNEEGAAQQGRQAIQQAFAAIFKENPKSQIQLKVTSIRFVSPTLAIEDGTSVATTKEGEPAERSRYTAVHIKQDGGWQMASARDFPDESAAGQEELQQLDWLVGHWVDESPEALIVTTYRWTDNHQFILGEFTVQVGGRPAMTGSQRIGWDPLAKKLRSWVFDSEGGFAEGVWTREGNQWLAKMTGVTREGKAASATNIIIRLSKDRMTWQSRDRVVGDDKMPDLQAIPVVRKPPAPSKGQ